jgi:hypothetical protein
MRGKRKIRIEDKYVLSVLFIKMKPALFYRMFEVDESDTSALLAAAALNYVETCDRKFNREDHLIFEFSERIWPKPLKDGGNINDS